jgi:chromosome segregation ATPase
MKNLYLFGIVVCTLLLASCGSSKDLTDAQTKAKTAMAEAQEAKNAAKEAEMNLQRCSQKNEALDQEANQQRQVARELQAENNSLTQELQYTREQLASMTQQMQTASDDYGVWFRVQIGAYEQRNIDSELNTSEDLALENKDNVQKISVGRFRQYDKAKRLQDQLKSMGVKDAWIVTFKDGKRVPIESVKGK